MPAFLPAPGAANLGHGSLVGYQEPPGRREEDVLAEVAHFQRQPPLFVFLAKQPMPDLNLQRLVLSMLLVLSS